MTTVRIAHITDTHLGYRGSRKSDPATGRNQRTVDFERSLERAIDDILAQQVDAVIHAGDVFHHTRPTWQTLRHFIQQFRRLERAGIPTLVIAGNHDTPRIRTGGSAFSVLDLALPDIRFVAEYEDLHEYDLFGHLDLHVHAIPHGALTNDDPVIPAVHPTRRNILTCHGMVRGILDPGMSAEPGERELDSALLSTEFDYIALGHYHMYMEASAKAWYAGSTERTGWGDREHKPGYVLVELDNPGDPARTRHVAIPARPMIDLKPVYGEGLRGRDIADKVLAQLEGLDEPEAMTRVAIRNTERADRREAEAILRRESGEFVWDLVFAAERSALDTLPDDRPRRTRNFPTCGNSSARSLTSARAATTTTSSPRPSSNAATRH
jgi:DNA repair exonuclease SbcCD nuclease subunit